MLFKFENEMLYAPWKTLYESSLKFMLVVPNKILDNCMEIRQIILRT